MLEEKLRSVCHIEDSNAFDMIETKKDSEVSNGSLKHGRIIPVDNYINNQAN